ncbi:hypothetical protein PG993_008448 [Apiospora rasikravindrae]|uniref:Uncharacterized protein n=1 Tax=Apiospora rasikravindrae TaxID=990691 RepID=A0ABR1T0D4_9PEZI
MYGPPEEDGYPDTPHKPYHAPAPPHPNRGADHAPEVVESHGMEYDTAATRSYPEAVPAPLSTAGSRTPLPEYSPSNNGKDHHHGGYAHTKEGGLEPHDSSHAVAISSGASRDRKRICGVSRLAFFAILSLLAVAIVATGLGVGLGLGLQHNRNGDATATTSAATASSSAGAAVPSPTSTVTPSSSSNATCQTGIRYCGWDLIEQHHYGVNLLQDAGSNDPYNDLYLCEEGNGIGWLEACGGAVQCQPPEHNGDGCDLQTRQSCCLPH